MKNICWSCGIPNCNIDIVDINSTPVHKITALKDANKDFKTRLNIQLICSETSIYRLWQLIHNFA